MHPRRFRARTLLVAGLLVGVLVLAACSAGGSSDPSSDSPARTGTSTSAPGSTPAPPDGPPRGVVAFDAAGPKGREIGVVDVGGGAARHLAVGSGGHAVRFSPDGRRLTYHRDRPGRKGVADAYVSDLRGVERRIGPGACPNWTRDGAALLVSRADGLYRLALDGRATRLARGKRCGLELGPGRYVRWNQGQVLDLLDHGRRTVLLRTHRCGIGSVGADRARRRISYTVACEDRSKPIVGLWTMDLATGRATKVMSGAVYGAAWSPDGGWLATDKIDRRADGTYRNRIWLVRTDGTDGRALTDGAIVNDPTWGPSTTAAES